MFLWSEVISTKINPAIGIIQEHLLEVEKHVQKQHKHSLQISNSKQIQEIQQKSSLRLSYTSFRN